MTYKTLRAIAITGLFFSATGSAFAATVPDDMTCKDFVDLNPQAASPVVYWVMNKDNINKEGDSFDITKVDAMVTPQVLELCKKNPEKKVSSLKQEIMGFAKKHL